MGPLNSRRDFIKNSGKAGLVLYISSSVLTSCATSKAITGGSQNTGFQQTPLPYTYGALTEAIDATTMEIHYSKHAASYANNLQTAAKNENVDTGKPLEDVLHKISKYSTTMRNNGEVIIIMNFSGSACHLAVMDGHQEKSLLPLMKVLVLLMLLKHNLPMQGRTDLEADGHGFILTMTKSYGSVQHLTRIIR